MLGLALAWANVVPPGSAADFELPLSVRPRSLGRPRRARRGPQPRLAMRRGGARRACKRSEARPSEVCRRAQQPEVLTESSERTVDLARRLRAAGARFYGAFWCSHCFEQKEAFGAAAAKELPYVECYPDGFHKVARRRRAAPQNRVSSACVENAVAVFGLHTCCDWLPAAVGDRGC